ncbi:hypothetical protein FMM05_13245 [Flavobacterium zepuense]|uniref:Methylamine utilisation protein MauE domain-containing protein n=1 Tax=Flavobacterium zepuense TaxID=2593302 RepID=A0A552UZI3_9FLAO|nr:hypothetical protein FMM05_13245 [Flavobacterium zepuense]
MRFLALFKKVIIELVCLSYILLFVYAATSKLIDYENFTVQLGQSPMLSALAEWIAPIILVSEFLLSILLLFPKYRLFALYAAFSLMVMFTTYISIILHYASYVPCSCGGILEKMGWSEHLYFNIFFILLAITGVLFYPPTQKSVI